MFKSIVEELLDKSLLERKDLFLTDFEILPGNIIRIVIDGDKGVLVEDCMYVSRAIEHNIDRDEYDFSLEVSSAGASASLTISRQFVKNIGRVLQVRTNDNDYEAQLVDATNDEIKLKWKQREPKKIGKGKVTVEKEINILYKDINEAKVKIKF
ncbi:ribosome assembly cofactor RimP [Flavobacteriaceae bacterium]|nr:ribosome assembly cofactor RimP [Flavobacteriaceae bacterium]